MALRPRWDWHEAEPGSSNPRRPWPAAGALTTAVSILFFPIALFVIAVVSGVAAQANVLEAQGVTVDITATSAATAREQAIVEAQRKAFRQVAAQLTGSGTVPNVSDDQIAPLVRDFSIVSEKASRVRYIATFDFRFDEGGVRRLLDRHDAPVIAPAEPVVVVPLYEAGGGQALWDDPNPWRRAWAAGPPTGGLVPTIVPSGDLTDVATVGPEQALAGDIVSLMNLAQHYGAAGALVARAVVDEEGSTDRPSVAVSAVRYLYGREQDRFGTTLAANAGETLDQLLGRAVAVVNDEMEARWRRQYDPGSGPRGVLAVDVPVNGLQDWLQVRGRLRSQPLVGEAALVAVSPRQVRLDLHYRGDLGALAGALGQDGLDLSRDGSRWILRPAAVGGR